MKSLIPGYILIKIQIGVISIYFIFKTRQNYVNGLKTYEYFPALIENFWCSQVHSKVHIHRLKHIFLGFLQFSRQIFSRIVTIDFAKTQFRISIQLDQYHHQRLKGSLSSELENLQIGHQNITKNTIVHVNKAKPNGICSAIRPRLKI